VCKRCKLSISLYPVEELFILLPAVRKLVHPRYSTTACTVYHVTRHPLCLWENYAAASLFGVAEVRRFAARRVDRIHVSTSLPTFALESFKFYADPIKARKREREEPAFLYFVLYL
jgi:hypothetical protein